ncbi:acyl carrier protein [Kordiimonas sp. SCSIO 12610]|uniref:acyl carrier protein n=1 Tax=Kordiimonas sp. SCSIO 12610 TaxID=2829597 RepID=UPI00210958E2|nr:acyl carrier protein [Kordiimonas sp. SCSIO 12610]UTW55883.1 acyl carrier protein [Kordiimonas sp. SCSIO 12610]
MNRDEITKKFQGIFQNIMGADGYTFSEETKPEDVAKWDSLNHVMLIVTTEQEFSIKFSVDEVEKFSCIGSFINSLSDKL